MGRERFHHHVDVIAVDAVDAHTEEVAEDPVMLGVPAKAEPIEAVKERGHSACPLVASQVDAVDTCFGEFVGPPFGTPTRDNRFHRRGIDEANVRIEYAPLRELLPVVMA